MRNKILSIIIPVYNTEKYLENCLNSVIKHSDNNFQTCEIILIDDGSIDSSGEICDKYAKNYLNIKVFHTKNGGVAKARNLGIHNSTGEMITFIDSDDSVTEDFFKVFEILNKNNQIDIYSFGIKRGNTQISCYEKMIESSKFDDLIWFAKNKVTISSCVKIARRKFILDNKLYFTPTTKSEDFEWSINCLLKSKLYKCEKLCYYDYYINTNSATHFNKIRGFEDHFYNINSVVNMLSEIVMTKKQRKKLYSYLFENNFHYLTRIRQVHKKDKPIVEQIFIQNKELFFKPCKFSYKIIYFMIKLLGVKNTLKIISIIQ